MSFYKFLIKKARLFHFTTSLPVRLFRKQELLFSLPSQITTLSALLDIPPINLELYNLYDNQFKSIYVKTDYNECFIGMGCKEYLVIIGPLLTSPILEGELNNIIRRNKISIKKKTALMSYYDSCPSMDKNRYYYCGKLLESLFRLQDPLNIENSITQEKDTMDSKEAFIPAEYFLNTLENRESVFHHPPYFLEKDICNHIRDGKLQEAKNVLQEINRMKRAKLTDNPMRSIKNSLIGSTTIFTRAIIEGGVDPESAFTLSDTIINKIEHTDLIKDLIDLEFKIVEDMIQLKTELTRLQYSIPIQGALTYIHDHLTEKITLQETSDHVFVHPNYLSSIFVKEVGMPFNAYINMKRIEEAKYYIRYTNTPLSDVSSFFQFCNQSYFTQLFKKYTGLTPKQYRNAKNKETT